MILAHDNVSSYDTYDHDDQSFRGKFAEAILQGRQAPKGFPADIAKVARRELVMVDAATTLDALRSPPANRLEALKGKSERQAFNQNQRSVADRLSMDRYWCGRCRDHRLSLRELPMPKKLPPVHPGEILREEFLTPLKLTPYAVAAAIAVPRTRVERLVREETPVSADIALRLGKYFKTGAAFWMNVQARYDLEMAEDALAPQIKKIEAYSAA